MKCLLLLIAAAVVVIAVLTLIGHAQFLQHVIKNNNDNNKLDHLFS